MTRLKPNSPLVRETAVCYQQQPRSAPGNRTPPRLPGCESERQAQPQIQRQLRRASRTRPDSRSSRHPLCQYTSPEAHQGLPWSPHIQQMTPPMPTCISAAASLHHSAARSRRHPASATHCLAPALSLPAPSLTNLRCFRRGPAPALPAVKGRRRAPRHTPTMPIHSTHACASPSRRR